MPPLPTGVLAGVAALLCAGHALASADAPADSQTALAPIPSPAVAFNGEKPAPPESREHWSLGAFGGVGVPRPLSVGAMVRVERTAGFGVEYSLLPNMSISGFDARFWALAGTMRVFPFRGAFFLGLGGGRQHIALTGSTPLGSASQSADGWFLNPQVGFLKVWSGGLTLGIDAGVQIPINPSYSSNVPSVVTSSSPVFDLVHSLGTSALPTLDLLRLGFTI